MDSQKTIFITGTSSGLGRASVKLFAAKGWRVLATMRGVDAQKETDLGKLPGVTVPIEMVAGEKESVLHEQDAMSLRVTCRGDGDETRNQFPRPSTVENHLRTWLR